MEHKSYVKNKSAQIFCVLFVQTYPKEVGIINLQWEL